MLSPVFVWAGLRVAGDMGWATRSFPGAEKMLEYERGFDDVFACGRLTGLCEYDRRLFNTQMIEQIARAHRENEVRPDDISTADNLRIAPTFAPFGAKIIGGVDASNIHVFERGIATLMSRAKGSIVIDLSELEFAEPAALYVLVKATRLVSMGGTLTLIAVPESLSQILKRNRWDRMTNLRLA